MKPQSLHQYNSRFENTPDIDSSIQEARILLGIVAGVVILVLNIGIAKNIADVSYAFGGCVVEGYQSDPTNEKCQTN